MAVRPNQFIINRNAPLALGAVFLGLGQQPFGTRFRDEARGNDGTLTDMDPATDWVFEPELGRWRQDFDGSNDCILCGANSGGAVGTGDFTWLCWYWTDSNAAEHSAMSWATYAPQLHTVASTGVWRLYPSGSFNTVAPTSTWCHAAVVRKNGTATFYHNGTADATTRASSTNMAAGGTFQIATARTYSYLTWAGRLSDCCFWNRALSLGEIAALADKSNTLLEVGGSPVIWTPRVRSYFYATPSGAPAEMWPGFLIRGSGLIGRRSLAATGRSSLIAG